MRDLSANRLDQARFFFNTTITECGNVLPALLGLAACDFLEKNYDKAQAKYAQAIKLYPSKSGAATRVGFGLACYKLGQVRRIVNRKIWKLFWIECYTRIGVLQFLTRIFLFLET